MARRDGRLDTRGAISAGRIGEMKIAEMSKEELVYYFELWARGRKNVDEIKAEIMSRMGDAEQLATTTLRFLEEGETAMARVHLRAAIEHFGKLKEKTA